MVISVHTVFTPSQTHSTAVSVPTRSVRWAISLVYGATSGFKVCWLFGVYTHVCTLAEYSNSNELCPFPMWQTSSMCKQEMGTITYRRPAPQMGTITYRRQLHSGVHVWWPKTDNKHAILGYTSTNPSSATSVPVLHRLHQYPSFIGYTSTHPSSATPVPILHWLHQYQSFIGYTNTHPSSATPVPILHRLHQYQSFIGIEASIRNIGMDWS